MTMSPKKSRYMKLSAAVAAAAALGMGGVAPAAAAPWRSRLPGGPAPEPVTLRWERLDRDGRAGQGDGADPGAGPWSPAGDAAARELVALPGRLMP